MECRVSELVKRGHDQAAELKSSCGAVDVRGVAQLIIDLAMQLDCTALALREMTKKRDADHADVLSWEKTMFKACGEDGLKSVAEKFSELQASRAHLAAENAGLRSVVSEINNELYGHGFQVSGWHLNGALEPLDSWFEENNWNPETPATEAFLAEVRAQVAEEALKKMGNFTSDECGDSVYIAIKEFAEDLRKGVQS